MDKELNPLEYYLKKIGDDLYMEEKDGGNIFCPHPIPVRGKLIRIRCSSQCAKFFTVCKIPQSLGLEIPGDVK